MFAGIVALDKKVDISSKLKSEMRRAFCPENALTPREIFTGGGFFIRANTESLTKYPGIYTEGGAVSLMAGEPLITKSGIENDHIEISKALENNDFEPLKAARGVFCAARYVEKSNPILELCSDKLGIRPVYYWFDGRLVVFSTTLKVLENLSIISKKADELALTETIAFGIPLGEKTKYESIKLLRESEIVRFTNKGVKYLTYWRWDKINQQTIAYNAAKEEAYRLFKEAVALRLNGRDSALAYLSGGMDSRAILGVLHELGVKVNAFNLSREGTQDQVFAKQFAEKIGCVFHWMQTDWNFSLHPRIYLARSVKKILQDEQILPSAQPAIWSGDGGSVSLGCVYLDEKIVKLIRTSNRIHGIQEFRKKNLHNLPLKALKSDRKEELSAILDDVVDQELDRLDCFDPGQAIFLFLMFNDQRRHLHNIYEDISKHNLEYQLPFFDSAFLEFIFSA